MVLLVFRRSTHQFVVVVDRLVTVGRARAQCNHMIFARSNILCDTGVAVIWGPPGYGDPRPNIASDIGMGVTISLSDMRLPIVPITLVVWGSSVIWGSLALLKLTVSCPRY